MSDRADVPNVADLVATMVGRPRWQAEGLCRRPENRGLTWFPVRGSHPALTAACRAVCEVCPVADPCLDFALDDPSLSGTWAGTSQRQREAIRKARQTAA